MDTNDLKLKALKLCIDIYCDYEEDEVKKWAPKSVQMAWLVGKEFSDSSRQKTKDKLKDFSLY